MATGGLASISGGMTDWGKSSNSNLINTLANSYDDYYGYGQYNPYLEWSNSPGLFGISNGTWQTGMGLAGLGLSLGQGILGYLQGQEQLSLAKDQFDFQKGLANRNLANQAKIINNQYDSSGAVAAAMAGREGNTDSATIDRYKRIAERKHVDGSPI